MVTAELLKEFQVERSIATKTKIRFLVKACIRVMHAVAIKADTGGLQFTTTLMDGHNYPHGELGPLRSRRFIHSFIHSAHFYSAPSSPLLLRGAPDYSTDVSRGFTPKRTGNCR